MLEKQGEAQRVQGYRNAYYCHSNIIQKNNRTYSAYCKTRYCLVCCANRKVNTRKTREKAPTKKDPKVRRHLYH